MKTQYYQIEKRESDRNFYDLIYTE